MPRGNIIFPSTSSLNRLRAMLDFERPPRDLVDAPTARLESAWGEAQGVRGLSHAMAATWFGRPDLQGAFDLKTEKGLIGFRRWCGRERHGGGLRSRAGRAFRRMAGVASGGSTSGVNLVGYAQGVLGMGEHIRMSAWAMRAAAIPCGVVDFTLGLGARRQPLETAVPTLQWPRYRCNLFHINADQMLRTYWHLGSGFFDGHYNIGYWAWELSRWPDQWLAVIATVDEIWAPSKFVRDALAKVTEKPVGWMPLCVELPEVVRRSRAEFGSAADDFLFAFTFDGHSYLDRKNPIALVKAFRAAFRDFEPARLIIKAMNVSVARDAWCRLQREAASDARIILIDEVWTRDKVLSLIAASDAYVSLHRSEGFGRGPAEAMLLGKPVVVTNYSGTADFCRPDNTLLVDYSLVPVEPGSYVAAAGQVWADPSIEHAARHMRALFEDRSLGPRIGAKGRQTIMEEFSSSAVGRLYRERLAEIGMI